MKKIIIYTSVSVVAIFLLLLLFSSNERETKILEHVGTIMTPEFSWKNHDGDFNVNMINTKIAFSDNDRYLATWPGNTFYVYDVETQALSHSLPGLKQEDPLPNAEEHAHMSLLGCFVLEECERYKPLFGVQIPQGFSILENNIKTNEKNYLSFKKFADENPDYNLINLLAYIEESKSRYKIIRSRHNGPSKNLVVNEETGASNVWDVPQEIFIHGMRHHPQTHDICLQAKEIFIYDNDNFYLINCNRLEQMKKLPVPQAKGTWRPRISSSVFNDDGSILAITYERSISRYALFSFNIFCTILLDTTTGKVITEIVHDEGYSISAFSPSSKYWAIAYDRRIEIYRINLPDPQMNAPLPASR